MLIEADWCWLFLFDAVWCWLMLDWRWIDAGLMLIDAGWYWLFLFDAVWCWFDADWCWLILIDAKRGAVSMVSPWRLRELRQLRRGKLGWASSIEQTLDSHSAATVVQRCAAGYRKETLENFESKKTRRRMCKSKNTPPPSASVSREWQKEKARDTARDRRAKEGECFEVSF